MASKAKNEQLLTLRKDTIPRELVLHVVGHTAECAARAGKIRGVKDFKKRIAQGNRLFLHDERMAPPAIDVARHVNAAARKRFWKQYKRRRLNEDKDGDESSDGAMRIRRANEGKHGDEWLELQTEGV